MRLLIFLSALLLTGCVSIYTASQPYDANRVSSQPCPKYVPPYRHELPAAPDFPDPNPDYVKFLEELTESLAHHANKLRDHIKRDETEQDAALVLHQIACHPQ